MISSSQHISGETSSSIRARMPLQASRPQQMLREGPVPLAPGAREPDFYERMTPRNQRLTQLYSVATLFSAVAFIFLFWSLLLVKTERLFSEKAKEHLLVPYSSTGYGLVMSIVSAGNPRDSANAKTDPACSCSPPRYSASRISRAS